MTPVELADPNHPAVTAGLARGCDICAATPTQHCRNLQGQPLTGGQIIHQYRAPQQKAEKP